MTITFKPIIRAASQTQNPSHNQLLQAQKGCCFYCEKVMGDWTRDHLFPKSHGFTLVGNLVFSCGKCNSRKADRHPTMEEIAKAVKLWRSCFKKPQKHRAAIVKTLNGKPRFKMTMSAEAIADWTM